MDPKQALLNCLRSVIAGNRASANDEWQTYKALRKEGWNVPKFDADDLMTELSNYF